MAVSETIQTIAKLTPLADVLLTVDADVKPVTPRTIEVFAATGRALAGDVLAPARPASALALQDGWALSSDETLGAGGHAPSPLVRTPSRIEAGQALPAGTDSVAPIDAVKVLDGRAEALLAINPGDGVLAPGTDTDSAIPLRRAGERLRSMDLAAFSAAGIARVTVREPECAATPGGEVRKDLARLVDDAAELASAGKGRVPAFTGPLSADSAARRQYSFSRLSGELHRVMMTTRSIRPPIS